MFLAVLNSPLPCKRGPHEDIKGYLVSSQDPELLSKIAKRKNQQPACPIQAENQARFLGHKTRHTRRQ